MKPFSAICHQVFALSIGALVSSGPVNAANTNLIAWPAGSLTNAPDFQTNAIQVAGGDLHCLARLADGSVKTWAAFLPPAGVSNVVSIAAGGVYDAAVRGDRSMILWGNITPKLPPEATNVAAVGSGPGAQHVLVLRADGTVLDWGLPETTAIPPGVVNIVSVAAGSRHAVALRSDGRVFAWGDNTYGSTSVPSSATNIVAIATTWRGNVALRANGTLLTWGLNPNIPNQATLGNVVEVAGSGAYGFSPGGGIALLQDGTVVANAAPPSATNIMVIGGSSKTHMAVRAAGPPIFPVPPVRRVVAAGQTAYLRHRAVGELPLTYQWSFQGVNLPGETSAVLVVPEALPAAQGVYTLVASNALGVVTNSEMELMVVPLVITHQPTNQVVYAGASPVVRVGDLGETPSYQWRFNGANLQGETGSSLTLTNIQVAGAGDYSVVLSNSFGSVTSVTAVISVEPILVTQTAVDQIVYRGGTARLSITAQASAPLAYQWQFNGHLLDGVTSPELVLTNLLYEQTGEYVVTATTANATTSRTGTVAVVEVAAWGGDVMGETLPFADATNLTAVSGGGAHSLALRRDGTVAAWRGDSVRMNVPPDLTNAVAISAGDNGSVALRAIGTVVAWGYNTYGQLNVPPNLNDVMAVAAGGDHNLALKRDGTVVAWGRNTNGQTNVPSDLTNVIAISAMNYLSVALTAAGRVIAWGDNSQGQTNVPSTLSNVVAVAAGRYHGIALRSDGTVALWGNTSVHGLGSIPQSATNIVAVGAGNSHCLVLRDDGNVIAWGYPTDGLPNIPVGLRNVTAIASGEKHDLALVGGMAYGDPVLAVHAAFSSSNGFKVTVPSTSGRVYRLEYKQSLSDNQWVALPLVPGNGAALTLVDTTATGAQRFYRVRRW